MQRGRASGREEDKVVDRDFGRACCLGVGVDFLPEFAERTGVDLHREIEVRDLRFADQEALRNRAAHSGEGSFGVRIRERNCDLLLRRCSSGWT